MERDTGFLSRWSRRKAGARQGRPLDEPAPAVPPTSVSETLPMPVPAPAPAASAEAAPDAAAASTARPPTPTLDDVAGLAPDAADFSRFVAPEVPADVRNAAMKKLFADPHFNVMDGLDVYIDDYSQPDPIPASMLRQLAQSRMLGLFDEPPESASPPPQPVPPAIALATAEPVADPGRPPLQDATAEATAAPDDPDDAIDPDVPSDPAPT